MTGPERTIKQLVLVASGAATGQWDTVFASDWFDTKFKPGTTLQLTVTFTDNTTVTATTP